MTRRTGILVAILSALAVILGLTSCSERAATKTGPIKAVVTVAPLRGILEPLMPPGSTISILMQPGRSEHGYEFTPSDLAQLANADLVVYVGLGLEGRLEEILKKQQVPGRQVVNFAEAVGIKSDEHDHHDHADHDSHDHDGDGKPDHAAADHHDEHEHAIDPHLWLDPALVGALVPELSAALLKVAGSRGQSVEKELARIDPLAMDLRKRIKATDNEWAEQLKPFQGQSVVTHHNAFQRLADRYNFKIAAVIREFDSDPTPGDLAKVIDAIRAQNVKAVFVEPQYNRAVATKIQEMAGVKVGELDPLGNGDWFELMRKNLDSLVVNLSDGARLSPSAIERGDAPATPPPQPSAAPQDHK